MAPDVLHALSPQAHEAMHWAVWVDAMTRPSTMPVVPRLGRKYTAQEAGDAVAAQKYRDVLDRALFPADEEPDLG